MASDGPPAEPHQSRCYSAYERLHATYVVVNAAQLGVVWNLRPDFVEIPGSASSKPVLTLLIDQ